MSKIKRVVDARRNQQRVLIHLDCGHVIAVTDDGLTGLPTMESELWPYRVGMDMKCGNCAEPKPPAKDPRCDVFWRDVYANAVNAGAGTQQATTAADEAVERYTNRWLA